MLGVLILGNACIHVEVAQGDHVAQVYGLQTLALVIRATLGHTGQTLTAGPVTLGISAALVLARLAAGLWPEDTSLMHMVDRPGSLPSPGMP